MNEVKLRIWNRDFDLVYTYQNFPGEEITDIQNQTLELLPSVDFEESLSYVEQYILDGYSLELGLDEIDNIFKYVMPRSILITREPDKRVFAIMCNFKFDMEHGLAVVFENEKYKDVGSQDLIL